MSRDARLISRVGSTDFEFRLGWGQLIALQEACDAGPFVILDRLGTRQWKADDVSVVLLLGLVGAGKSHVDALRIVESWLADDSERLPVENAALAYAVLAAGLVGAPDEPLGKQ